MFSKRNFGVRISYVMFLNQLIRKKALMSFFKENPTAIDHPEQAIEFVLDHLRCINLEDKCSLVVSFQPYEIFNEVFFFCCFL